LEAMSGEELFLLIAVIFFGLHHSGADLPFRGLYIMDHWMVLAGTAGC
jgi:hypothetical protein